MSIAEQALVSADFMCSEHPSEHAINEFVRLCEEADARLGEARSTAFLSFATTTPQVSLDATAQVSLDGVTTTRQ